MPAPPAPTPKHVLRSHTAPAAPIAEPLPTGASGGGSGSGSGSGSGAAGTGTAQVHALWISDDNERVYSGDATGVVVATSTRTLRALAAWRAHAAGVLGVQEWGARVVTHGRDNKLHVWQGVHAAAASASSSREGEGHPDATTAPTPAPAPEPEPEPAHTLGAGSATQPGLPVPELLVSLDVNALNYCRFSLLPLNLPRPALDADDGREALLAVPNLVESAYADVWTLPGKQRLHAAIGKAAGGTGAASSGAGSGVNAPDGRGLGDSSGNGIIMSMHLSSAAHPHAAGRARLRLLCGYEDGSVAMREYARGDRETSVEGVGWDVLWTVRLHVESVMGMAVSRDGAFALTVSADHIVGKYDLKEAEKPGAVSTACHAHRTKHPGNGCVAIRDDGKICAVGGWDGKIRLYSTKTFKPLGTLAYHKSTCQALAFARSQPEPWTTNPLGEADDDDDDMSEAEKAERSRWLVSGSHDNRVAIWALMDFGKS